MMRIIATVTYEFDDALEHADERLNQIISDGILRPYSEQHILKLDGTELTLPAIAPVRYTKNLTIR
jgi:hypothetical protein